MATDLGTKSYSSPSRLGYQIRRGKDYACDVAARMVEIGDEAGSNWIATANKDDWYRCGCSHHRARCQNIPGYDGRPPMN